MFPSHFHYSVYQNILPASKVSSGSTYHFFKTGIKPAWEDAKNAPGGSWKYAIPKGRKEQTDTMWMNLVRLG
jgi:hypothetical protein